MKRFLSLILVFVCLFALFSCSDKKSHKKEEVAKAESVSKEVSAEEGGKVESSDGSISIEIPGGALDSDTTIKMTIYNSTAFPKKKGEEIISKVVEFEPSGTIFKKPVVISMTSEEKIENKIITAAVYRENEKEWSYSGEVTVKFSGYTETGDPIMMSATGDPVTVNAKGDPVTMNATGDPIMLAATGDPIMMSATGDPIMMTATGDPIMMTTGHFSSYTFLAVDKKEGEPVDDTDDTDDTDDSDDTEEPVDDGDDEPVETDDDEPAEPDDDEPADDTDTVIPEPEPQYSKVVCTNMAICTNDNGEQIICPAEDTDFYGQDAQYAARKSCVPHRSFAKVPKPEIIENDFVEVKDDFTGLTWLFTGMKGAYEDLKNGCDISYGGKEDWRLPTPKEFFTLSHNEMLFRGIAAVDPFYFGKIVESGEDSGYFGVYAWSSIEGYLYSFENGGLLPLDLYAQYSSYFTEGLLACVSGKEYGKVKAANYVPVAGSEGKVILDAGTNLYWQKDPAQADTWKEALSYCENLEYAGFDDWRLPNKNELLSLVDYSKAGTEAEVFSSFPGMTPDIFWSSTGSNYGAWVIYMKDGTLDASEGAGGGGVVVVDNAFTRSIKRDEIEEEEEEYEPRQAVRCVRSLLDEKTDIPACGETGIAPCKDANGTVWSSVIYPKFFAGFDTELIHESGGGGCGGECRGSDKSVSSLYSYSIIDVCRNLYESGSHKWRLPTIDEIRSLVTTEKIKTGGSCGVTNEHFESSDFTEEACTGDDSSETVLFDYGFMLSGTYFFEESEEISILEFWGVSVKEGALAAISGEIPLSELAQRCVLDETLNYEETPYLDPETGLLWSDISSDYLEFQEAEDYCFDLTMEDMEHFWRLPTVDELLTLVVNCSEEEAPCPMDLNGKYSIFRDNSDLWSSEEVGNDHYIVYFEDASVWKGHYSSYTRCVSDGPNPCNNDPCAADPLATGCFPDSSEIYHCGCEENYTWNGEDKVCKANTKTENCNAELPENAEWWSESITQTWSGNAWLPATGDVAIYSYEEVENECRFKCSEGYLWESEKCLPECGSDNKFPCIDPETMLIWSSRSDEEIGMDFGTAASHCEGINEGGFTDWRLPTIDELRTLIQNCAGSQADGECAISDLEDHLSDADYIAGDCTCDDIENNEGHYSKLGDDDTVSLWSSSARSDKTYYYWLVDFISGSLYSKDEESPYYVRCVRKEQHVLPSN